MPKQSAETLLVEQATQAFRLRLAERIADRDVGLPTNVAQDPGGIGEEAADFAASRFDVGRSELARRIGPVHRTEDLARWLTSSSVGPLTGEAVRKRAKARQLVAFRTDDGHWAYPAWQFDAIAGRLMPRRSVIALWRDLPHDGFLTAADLAAWMQTRLVSLGGTPVDHVLTRGRTEQLDHALKRLASRVAA